MISKGFSVSYWTKGVKGARVQFFDTREEAAAFAVGKQCYARPAAVNDCSVRPVVTTGMLEREAEERAIAAAPPERRDEVKRALIRARWAPKSRRA